MMTTNITFESPGSIINLEAEITPTLTVNRKILVIDDDQAILATYRSILQPQASGAESLFNLLGEHQLEVREKFEVVTATQGQLGVERVRDALSQNSPFSVVFVDMRMPPGWDGLRTAQALRTLDPNLYIVVASAYADYTADQIQAALTRDAVLLRKPFGRDEVYQLARTLAQGWSNRRFLQDLNHVLEARIAAHAAERKRYLALGNMLAEVSARCAIMRNESLAQNLSWVLEWLERVMMVEYCYLATWKEDESGIEIHQYHASEHTKNAFRDNIKDHIISLRASLEAGTMIAGVPMISNSTIVIALTWKQGTHGLLGCEVVGQERNWSAEDVNLLTTVACVVSRLFENENTATE
ncbi:hypothetical protein CCP3SC5AM1_1030008 [Gammaproteobacteria bacterium]